MADKMLKIELKKSLIGRGAKQIATAEALGLKKPGDVTVLKIMQPGQAGQFPLSMKTGNMYFINNITDIS